LVVQATGEDPAEVLEEELRAYRRHLLVTLREARDQLGRWPGGPEWDTATADHAARTYVRQSRSWKAICVVVAAKSRSLPLTVKNVKASTSLVS
jgi:hypothetical protein